MDRSWWKTSDKMWSTGEGNGKPHQYSCLENPMNTMKRQGCFFLLPQPSDNTYISYIGRQILYHWATREALCCCWVSHGFCWLYRASPSSAAKNIINLILIWTIWWCPCIESPLVLLEEGIAMTSAFSWQNSISLCPASFCTPRPNLKVFLDFLLWHSSPL